MDKDSKRRLFLGGFLLLVLAIILVASTDNPVRRKFSGQTCSDWTNTCWVAEDTRAFSEKNVSEQAYIVDKGYFGSCDEVLSFCKKYTQQTGCLKYCEGKY